MTDKPEKAARGTTPLTPEAVVKDARLRRSTATARIEDHRRIAEEAIREVDAKRLADRLARVPEADRDECRKMLAAIGIVVADVPPAGPSVVTTDSEPEVTMGDPEPAEEASNVRGTAPYVPGPAAQRARAR